MNMTRDRWPTAIDLFCGCGAVSEALKKRHFRVVAAVDNNPDAATTYASNHPTVQLFVDDIRNINPKEMHAQCLAGRSLDLLVVCAPCQPFSSQNGSQKVDTRSELLLASLRYIREFEPKVIFFENVPGLTRPRFRPILDTLLRRLRRYGYSILGPHKVDVADYGVPQRRVRCIMVARKGEAPPPIPAPVTPKGCRLTVRDAIADLTPLRSGESDSSDPLHVARRHSILTLERLRHIPQDGGSRNSLPENLQLQCHTRPNQYPDVYGRMSWDSVAPTLTTGCTDLTRGRFAHPRDNRSLSVREAARLQTFPDTYQFPGSLKQASVQIGNAVPVRFIEMLAPWLRESIAQ